MPTERRPLTHPQAGRMIPSTATLIGPRPSGTTASSSRWARAAWARCIGRHQAAPGRGPQGSAPRPDTQSDGLIWKPDNQAMSRRLLKFNGGSVDDYATLSTPTLSPSC